MNFNRRSFLQSSALIAGSAAALPTKSYGRIIGSNAKFRLAVIGLNGRGRSHLSGLKDHVVAICDCDQAILENRAKDMDVDRITDYRKLMERKDIDAVSIATPNHLHSIIGIAAAMAGKHVYCEKPVSHNVWEGRQLVHAAEMNGIVMQCGTQSRSSPGLQQAVAYVRSGKLGKIKYAIGTCYKPRKSIGKLKSPMSIPKSVDYDLWCGPAEKRSLYRPRLHYDWHWDFNTGNGDMGNQGIHQMDLARWFLGYDTISPRILSIGGRLGYDDAGDTPNTQTVIHDYPDAPLIFETRGLPRAKEFQNKGWGGNMDNYRGTRIGVIVQCEKGHVVIPSYQQAIVFDNDNVKIEQWNEGGNHYQNFISAVEAGDPSSLNAPIVDGHLSSALCHTGGLSHQLGRTVSIKEIESQMNDESEVFRDSVARLATHLKANGVDVSNGNVVTLGADLKMNTTSEEFIGNEKATAMLSREYRQGFVVPDLGKKISG